MNVYTTTNNILESSQVEVSNLGDFLSMSEDYRNSLILETLRNELNPEN